MMRAASGFTPETPDQEEVSYTKRMLAMKDEEQFGSVSGGPIALPPAKVSKPPEQERPVSQTVKPEPQPPLRTYESVREQKPLPQADQVASKLVQTAHSRYNEEQSSASYKPAGTQQKPQAQHQKQMQASAPRVFDYRKQPKKQTVQKSPVTRVKQSRQSSMDEEEQ